MNKEIIINQQDLIDWIDRPPSNEDLDLIDWLVNRLEIFYRLEKENKQLKEDYERIYNENCKLREEHNITDISLLDENQQLKKQKDDVVEIIKRQLLSNTNITKYTDEMCLRDLLRMLGEINYE